MYLSWANFKTILSDKNIKPQVKEKSTGYLVFGYDHLIEYKCWIQKTDPTNQDQTDFENNYLSSCNKSIEVKDLDGKEAVKIELASEDRMLEARYFSFETSKLNSLNNINYNGNDIGDISIIFYNNQDTELTTQNDIDSGCVKTQVIFEPTYSFEILAGDLRLITTPAVDINCFYVMNTGTDNEKVRCKNFNLKYMTEKYHMCDGKSTDLVKYVEGQHLTKMDMFFLHPAGTKCSMQIGIMHYS